MGDWAQWGTQLLGTVANTYANYEWNANPDVIKAKALADSGYYSMGKAGGVPVQGGVTVTSDILVLGGLALLMVFAMRD